MNTYVTVQGHSKRDASVIKGLHKRSGMVGSSKSELGVSNDEIYLCSGSGVEPHA